MASAQWGRRLAGAVIVLAAGAACSASSPDGRGDPLGTAGTTGQGTGPEPSSETLPGAVLFAPDQVLQIHLTLSAVDHTLLEEQGDDESYVPAQASISGTGLGSVELGEVGLRHKGSWSLHHCWDDSQGVRSHEGPCQKLSYKLKLDELQSQTRLDGLKRLNLHASSGDATRLHELLAYDTFRAFDVDAPRTALAQVYVNGVPEGLFIAVEAIDGRYAKAHFPAGGGDGNLYKEIWPSPALDVAELREALTTNEELGDVTAFQQFASAVAGASAEGFDSAMARWVDLEHTLRYIAVDRALKNWDGIMAFYTPSTPHNFYWYHDAGGSGRFQLIPWDLDNTFWEFDPYMAPSQWVTAPAIPDWNEEPLDCNARAIWTPDSTESVTPPRCDPFLDHLARTHWAHFEGVSAELLAGPLSLSRLLERAQHYRTLLRPLVAADPGLDEQQWLAETQAFESTLAGSVDDFRAYAARGLGREQAPPPPAAGTVQNAGLDAALSNGFEFSTASAGTAPVGVFEYGGEGTSSATLLNATGAIAGAYDLRCDFTFTRLPGAWNEWVNFGYSTAGGQTVDVRGKTSLVLSLRADRPRSVRIRLDSPAYVDTFGGAWSELGIDVGVSATTSTLVLPLASFSYAPWAREAWTEGQGWSGTDAAAAQQVLSRFSGLLFAPAASMDVAGELLTESETGFLQVDDIRLE
ncbi:MAG: hypothetical protein RL033_495 [Pseudomonadota bacterium]|jgi:hypothetical protein